MLKPISEHVAAQTSAGTQPLGLGRSRRPRRHHDAHICQKTGRKHGKAIPLQRSSSVAAASKSTKEQVEKSPPRHSKKQQTDQGRTVLQTLGRPSMSKQGQQIVLARCLPSAWCQPEIAYQIAAMPSCTGNCGKEENSTSTQKTCANRLCKRRQATNSWWF